MAGAVETVTISTVDHNVYGLGNTDPVGDADDYFGARLGASSWTGATADQKAQALVTARRMMDRRVVWAGTLTVASQTEAWPRDSATCDGVAVTDGTIPDNVVYGQFELALALLEDEAVQDNTGSGSNLKRAKAGSAEVEFFRPTQGAAGQDFPLPVVAWELVKCYTDGSTALGTPWVDGTDATALDERSAFDSCTDSYGRTDGYA